MAAITEREKRVGLHLPLDVSGLDAGRLSLRRFGARA